ncbi:hypothetical protein KFL_001340010, partial [Klebsormidium nitens]
MVTIRQALESVPRITSAEVELLLRHIRAAGFNDDEPADGVFLDLNPAKIHVYGKLDPLDGKHQLILQRAQSTSAAAARGGGAEGAGASGAVEMPDVDYGR